MLPHRLRYEYAPPLAIPLSFFLTAPLAVAAAGALLLWNGAEALSSRWSPLTLSVTHLGTLGFLTMVMMGALYQMIAVVVGSPVPRVRLAHAVHALYTTGVAALIWGIAHSDSDVVFNAIGALGPALLLFLIPVAIAVSRVQTFDATAFGIRAALLSFFLAAGAGLWMAHGFGGMRFPGPRELWIQGHVCIAFFGWVGGLIAAVSWRVLPMFYLAQKVDARVRWTIQILAAAGALLPAALLLADYFGGFETGGESLAALVALAALPGALAIWAMHPAACYFSLRQRRRKRGDSSMDFWRAGLALAPITGLAAAASYALPSERWDLLFGWLAIWGWAGCIVHGMLNRIAPFLVWLHRFAPLIGQSNVPSAKKLLPDRWTRVGLALHLATLGIGVLAISTGGDLLGRATGLGLLATAGSLGHSLLRVALARSTSQPTAPPGVPENA